MKRYFYTLVDGPCEADDTGTLLGDDATARAELVRFASEILRDAPERLQYSGQLEISLRDEAGEMVDTICISLAERKRPEVDLR